MHMESSMSNNVSLKSTQYLKRICPNAHINLWLYVYIHLEESVNKIKGMIKTCCFYVTSLVKTVNILQIVPGICKCMSTTVLARI